jgi:hypothetical protein
MRKILFTTAACWLTSLAAFAQDIVFPANANVVNVKAAPYSAKGDGVSDDTQALQKAISDNLGRIIYLPAGTYLLSNRLEGKSSDGKWNGGLHLQGAGEATTVLKLKANAVGYQDPSIPKAVVYPASSLFVEQPYGGGKDYPALGEGNEAFNNYVQNLTIDTNSGNAGAVALDYLCNNTGAVRHVTLKGTGVAGLSLLRKWPWPLPGRVPDGAGLPVRHPGPALSVQRHAGAHQAQRAERGRHQKHRQRTQHPRPAEHQQRARAA